MRRDGSYRLTSPELLALICFQYFLTQPNRLRRYFYVFVFANELDRLLQIEDSRRD